jgi:Zn-dependent protease with chaperone function
MPDSCWNALRPTIALFGCTAYPVRRDTRRLARAISRVLIAVVNPLSAFRGGLATMFSTHPPIEERIARLEAIARGERPR